MLITLPLPPQLLGMPLMRIMDMRLGTMALSTKAKRIARAMKKTSWTKTNSSTAPPATVSSTHLEATTVRRVRRSTSTIPSSRTFLRAPSEIWRLASSQRAT